MCGRYITPEEADIEREWNLTPSGAYHRSFNLAPSQLSLVIRVDEHGNLTLAELK